MLYSREIIKAIYRSLPEELNQVVAAPETAAANDEIARIYNLEKNQRLAMGDEITMRLLGVTTGSSFIPNLQTRLGVTLEIAQKIAGDIQTTVLAKVPEKILAAQENYARTKLTDTEDNHDLIESVHDESGAENIRKILKANAGADRDKLIGDQLKKLPEALQQAIQIVPWKSAVKEIALLNKLDLAQIVAVERETMFVVYGFEDEKNYLANIMREANLDEALATTITTDLNEKVFKVIINRADEVKPATEKTTVRVPEIPPTNLPMVEEWEVAHDVAPATSEVGSKVQEVRKEESKAPLPDYRYPDGKDPYREPLM